MADTIFNSFLEAVGDGTHDMDGDTFYIQLHTSSYTIDATDAVLTDLNNEVANGNGYATGGIALTPVTWTQTTGTLKFDSTMAPAWTSASFTARHAVIYNQSTTEATDPLVCLLDFGEDKVVTNGTFTINFNTSGIFTIAQA